MDELEVQIALISSDLALLAERVAVAKAAPAPTAEPVAPKLMLTVEEACEALRVSRSGLFVLLGSGELHSTKIGRRRLVPVASLQSYVERITVTRGAA